MGPAPSFPAYTLTEAGRFITELSVVILDARFDGMLDAWFDTWFDDSTGDTSDVH